MRKTGGDFETDWLRQQRVKCYIWYRTNLNGRVCTCRSGWTAYRWTGGEKDRWGFWNWLTWAVEGQMLCMMEQIWVVEFAYGDLAEQFIGRLGGEKDRWGFWNWLASATEGQVLCVIENKSESLSLHMYICRWFHFTTLLWVYDCPGGDFEAD